MKPVNQKIKNNQIITEVIKHAPVYFSGPFISAIVGVLMAKYYTFVFSPAQYGILALYALMLQYVVKLVSLNMDGAASRLYFDYRNTKKNIYLNSILIWIVIAGSLVLAIGIILRPIIVSIIEPNSDLLYLATLFTGFIMAVNSVFNRVLINEKKSTSILKNSLINLSINHLISFALISGAGLGLLGRLLGQLCGNIANAGAIQYEFIKKRYIRYKQLFYWPMVKETILLAIPSVLTSLQSLLFVYLDRIFLKFFHGNTEVGIYSFGFLIGKGLSMVFEAISNILTPKCYELMKKDYNTGIHELERFSVIYCIGLVLLTFIIVILSPFIIRLLSNENYANAAYVLPFIVCGFMMGGIYKIPTVVLGFHKVVWFYPILAFFAFGINAGLNYLLIPEYKEVGAAFASFIGLFLYSSVLQLMAMKFHVSLKYKLFIFCFYPLLIICVTMFFLSQI